MTNLPKHLKDDLRDGMDPNLILDDELRMSQDEYERFLDARAEEEREDLLSQRPQEGEEDDE